MRPVTPASQDPSRRTARRSLFPIGLQSRDRLSNSLGGGLPRGSIVLIEGQYGAGKSSLCQRFVYGLAEEFYQSTLVSTELTTGGFIGQMHSLNYDVTRHLLDRRILFLHADVQRGTSLQRAPPAHHRERRSLLAPLMNATKMWESDVIVIDTFDSILRNDAVFDALVRYDGGRQAALEILSFFRFIAATGRTIVITMDPTTVTDETIGPFRSIADVILDLTMEDVAREVRRSIRVKRFAGMGDQVADHIGFSVRAGTGIVIETRSVVS